MGSDGLGGPYGPSTDNRVQAKKSLMVTVKTYDYRLNGSPWGTPEGIAPSTIVVIGSAEINIGQVASIEYLGHNLHMVYMSGPTKRYAIDSDDLKRLKES